MHHYYSICLTEDFQIWSSFSFRTHGNFFPGQRSFGIYSIHAFVFLCPSLKTVSLRMDLFGWISSQISVVTDICSELICLSNCYMKTDLKFIFMNHVSIEKLFKSALITQNFSFNLKEYNTNVNYKKAIPC